MVVDDFLDVGSTRFKVLKTFFESEGVKCCVQ